MGGTPQPDPARPDARLNGAPACPESPGTRYERDERDETTRPGVRPAAGIVRLLRFFRTSYLPRRAAVRPAGTDETPALVLPADPRLTHDKTDETSRSPRKAGIRDGPGRFCQPAHRPRRAAR